VQRSSTQIASVAGWEPSSDTQRRSWKQPRAAA